MEGVPAAGRGTSGWAGRLARGLPRRGDGALGVALAVFGLIDLWALHLTTELSARPAISTVFAIAVPATLAWRRSRPLSAASCCAGALTVQAFTVAPTTSICQVVSLLVLSYSLAAHAAVALQAGLGLAACLLAVGGIAVASASSVGGVLSIAAFLGVPFLAGIAVRTSRSHARRVEMLTQELVAERERSAQLILAQERNRIARELHDVVAHGVGVMVVQAGGGRRIIDQDPARARTALAAIEATGRAALKDLERTVAVLRDAGPAASSVSPPGLADLPALEQQLRDSGIAVAASVTGTSRQLPAAVEQAVFRIMQEALTNAVKHAPGASISIEIGWVRDGIEFSVTDTGPVAGTPKAGGGGHGLIGMRERVGLFGGALETGPLANGGYRVWASIPVPVAGS